MPASDRLVIDPCGRLHPVESFHGCSAWRVLRWLPGSTPSNASSDALVIEHGCACIAPRADDSLMVWVNAARLTPKIVAALLEVLVHHDPDRLAISSWHHGWSARIAHDEDQIAAAVKELLDREWCQPPASFMSKMLPLDAAARWPMLGQLFDAALSNCMNWRHLQPSASALTGSRFLAAAPGECGETLLIRDIGANYGVFDPAWRACAPGRPLHEQADGAYGAWLQDCYLGVLAANEPRLEQIDAVVTRPDQGRKRFQYTRLMLPLRDAGGNRLVLSASVTDAVIDLDGPSGTNLPRIA